MTIKYDAEMTRKLGENMLKKLALDKTKIYETCIAKEQIAGMLVDYVRGKTHILGIGSEQGNIPTWDDFVIEHNDSSKTYVQVKRQTTSFGKKGDCVVRGMDEKGQPQGLSEFDKVFKALAKVTADNSHDKDNFRIYLPDGSIFIKKELAIRDFRNVRESVKPITLGKDLHKQSSIDKRIQNTYSWLTTWCGFNDWEHIVKAMKLLTINVIGYEQDIDSRAKEKLREIFVDDSVDTVYSLLGDYLGINSTYAGVFRPRELLIQFHQYLLPNLERWTLFKEDGSNWLISGINDLERNDGSEKLEIERASKVAEALWKSENTHRCCLKIGGRFLEKDKVTKCLMRLSLHFDGLKTTYISQPDLWLNNIGRIVGGTLGIGKNDTHSLNVIALDSTINSETECYKLPTMGTKEEYARELNNEMYSIVLQKVNLEIIDRIHEMNPTALRNRLEQCWNVWREELSEKDAVRNKYFSDILHPESEGDSISGELRVGCKTVEIIANAIFLTMVVVTVFNDDGNYNWTSINSKLKIRTIGLQFWSGSAGSSKKVIEIDDEDEISKLLEQEKEEVIILSGSKEPIDYLLGEDIAGNLMHNGLLSDCKRPQLVVPYNKVVKKLIDHGNISEIKDYFQGQIDKYNKRIDEAIKRIIE